MAPDNFSETSEQKSEVRKKKQALFGWIILYVHFREILSKSYSTTFPEVKKMAQEA